MPDVHPEIDSNIDAPTAVGYEIDEQGIDRIKIDAAMITPELMAALSVQLNADYKASGDHIDTPVPGAGFKRDIIRPYNTALARASDIAKTVALIMRKEGIDSTERFMGFSVHNQPLPKAGDTVLLPAGTVIYGIDSTRSHEGKTITRRQSVVARLVSPGFWDNWIAKDYDYVWKPPVIRWHTSSGHSRWAEL